MTLSGFLDRWRKRTLPRDRDVTFRAANALHKTLNPTLEYPHFSTLKWARAYIQVTAPEARVEIDRLEADQKFFRGLVVIAALAAAHFLLRELAPAAGLGAILMGVMSYQRYCDRRLKMTELAYGTAVIVEPTNTEASYRS